MPAVAATLVTVIVSFDLKGFVEEELERRKLHGYTVGTAEGHGRHGHQSGGLIAPKNYVFSVIVNAATARALLAWIDATLTEGRAAIAYAQEIRVVPASIVH
ncbi:MAG: P-II family nitrogen regulator [Polyangiales bacterium]